MEKTTNKVAYLDGIRGVAALSVFLHHYLMVFYSSVYSLDPAASHLHNMEINYGQSLLSVLSGGYFPVCVFFVLSGYVLSRKYFLTNNTEVLVSSAYRRFIRLYVPVAFTMILAFLLIKFGLFYNVPASRIQHSESWLGSMWTFPEPFHRLLMCLRVSTMFQGDNAFDTTLWTMSVELTGSFLVFAFLALTHNARNKQVSLFLLFSLCAITYNRPMATFVFGISLNYVENAAPSLGSHRAGIIATIFLVAGLLLGSFPDSGNISGTVFAHMSWVFTKAEHWVHLTGAYLLVTAFVLSCPLQRFVSLRVFRFFGYISFALYLIHPLIMGSLSCYLLLHMYPSIGYNHAALYIFLLTTAVCIPASWLMTKYIDEPGIWLSKYIYNMWFKKKEPEITSGSAT
jgi:peptidoglycan/LPS O-acetylase OafA/YrhL